MALRYRQPLHDLDRYDALLNKRESEAQTDMERLVIATLRMKVDPRRYFDWARDDEYR